MLSFNIFDAKTNLSKYISYITDNSEPYIIIMRNGSPVAKLVPYTQDSSVKLGLGKGILPELSSLESFNSISIDDSFIGNGEII